MNRSHGTHRRQRARTLCRDIGVAWMFALLAACGDSTTVTVDVARVEVTPATATAQAGTTITLTARAFDGEGNIVSAPTLRWSSSDNAVATVSAAGVVTGVTAGTARVAVSSMGRSAVATVTVTPRAVASLVVSPAQASVLVGRTTKLSAQPLDANGAPLVGRTVSWSTSDATVAGVGVDGTVTGVAPGAATIVAASEGRTAQVAVTVTVPPVQSVTVAPALDTLAVTGTRQYAAELRDANGVVLGGRVITWTTGNPAVALVSATGTVTALAPGNTTITASSEGRSGTAALVVLARLASSVTVTPGVASIIVGNTLALSAQVTDAQGNVLSGRPLTFTSDAPAVATVNANGIVTAVGPGTARIVVTSEGKTGKATVQVNPVPAASLSLSPANATLIVDDAVTLVPTVRAASGAVLSGRVVEWRSGAPNVATVSTAGLVSAIAPGTAVILASVEGITATATVTVRVPAVASVTLAPINATIDPAQSVQLTATTRSASGVTLTGRTVTWSSLNEQVAFVSSAGLVVGARPGTAIITATSEGISASTTVTVR